MKQKFNVSCVVPVRDDHEVDFLDRIFEFNFDDTCFSTIECDGVSFDGNWTVFEMRYVMEDQDVIGAIYRGRGDDVRLDDDGLPYRVEESFTVDEYPGTYREEGTFEVRCDSEDLFGTDDDAVLEIVDADFRGEYDWKGMEVEGCVSSFITLDDDFDCSVRLTEPMFKTNIR